MTTIPSSISLHSRILTLEQELNQIFLEREEFIRVIILSFLTRQHALVFGLHGAAKSALIRTAASAFTGGYFGIQLGKDTTRDELFGPIKISQLQHDKLCRAYENFLPGQPFVFLDEIDKANSVILNSLYTAMEERLFLNDGMMQPMPLVSLFGAANNITVFQSKELSPLLDRFLFRIEVEWIQSDASFLEFFRRKAERDSPTVTSSLTLQELTALHLEIAQVQFPRDVQESVVKLRKDLVNEGILVSDRRWGHIAKLLPAIAFLEGDSFVSEEHFAFLWHCLWTDKKQIATIQNILKLFNQGIPSKIRQLLGAMETQIQNLMQNSDPQFVLGESALMINSLSTLLNELEKLNQTRKITIVVQNIVTTIQKIEVHRNTVCDL